MPWSIIHDRASLRVQVSVPVQDWEALLDAIQNHLRNRTHTVAMATVLPGATRIDAEMFQLLRRTLEGKAVELVAPSEASSRVGKSVR